MMSNLPGMTIETIVGWSHTSLVTTRRDLADVKATVKRLEGLLEKAGKEKPKLQALAAESQLHLHGQAVIKARASAARPLSSLDRAQQCHHSYQEAQAALKALQQRIRRCSTPEVKLENDILLLTRAGGRTG